MRKETVFSIQELRHVSITCPHCATQVILDMAAYRIKVPPDIGDRFRFAPQQCPTCRKPYDTALNALEEIQKAYALLSRLQGVVAFRVEVDGDEEEA